MDDAIDTVYITGFGPFDNHQLNASWKAVKLLPLTNIESECKIKLVLEEIPVLYDFVCHEVPKRWQKFKPLLVVHVGVSSRAIGIELEKSAHNVGYERLDVNECCVADGKCIGNCDLEILYSDLDLDETCRKVNERENLQAVISNDAGHYLCDFIYFTSLWQGRNCVFVHVPTVDLYDSNITAEGLCIVVKNLVEQIRRRQ